MFGKFVTLPHPSVPRVSLVYGVLEDAQTNLGMQYALLLRVSSKFGACNASEAILA